MTILPPENVDRVEQATSAYLARTLDGQRGKAAAAFRARLAPGGEGIAPAAYSFEAAQGMRRLKMWAGAASALAACLALVVTFQFVAGRGESARPISGAVASGQKNLNVTDVSAPAMDQVELSRELDGGTAMLNDNTPVRVVRHQTLRQTQWFDPQDRATYQVTEPGEQVNYVPMHPY